MLLNALTVTVIDPVAVYVCEGVESEVAVVVSPSPHVIVYLFAPPPTVEIVRVIVVPLDAAVVSATKETDFTNVFALMFSMVSLRSSIAPVTE